MQFERKVRKHLFDGIFGRSRETSRRSSFMSSFLSLFVVSVPGRAGGRKEAMVWIVLYQGSTGQHKQVILLQ